MLSLVSRTLTIWHNSCRFSWCQCFIVRIPQGEDKRQPRDTMVTQWRWWIRTFKYAIRLRLHNSQLYARMRYPVHLQWWPIVDMRTTCVMLWRFSLSPPPPPIAPPPSPLRQSLANVRDRDDPMHPRWWWESMCSANNKLEALLHSIVCRAYNIINSIPLLVYLQCTIKWSGVALARPAASTWEFGFMVRQLGSSLHWHRPLCSVSPCRSADSPCWSIEFWI